jgi:Tfp pilus assembly protein PilZ
MRTCIVVATSEATRTFVAASLESMGMGSVLVASLGDLPSTLDVTPSCGILLELSTAITALPQHKKAVQELLEHYPLAKFRFAGGQVLIVGEDLKGFVGRCLQFKPRVTRKAARKDRYLALRLSADESFEDAEKVVTFNVSDGGYFVFTVRAWKIGDRVWMRFFGDEATICGTVRSLRPWGNDKFFPGIGVKIEAGGEGIG